MDPQAAPSFQFHRPAIALVQTPVRAAKIPHSESGHRDGNRRRCGCQDPAPDALSPACLPWESIELRVGSTTPLPTVHARPISKKELQLDWTQSPSISPEGPVQKFHDPYETSEYMAKTLPGATVGPPGAASGKPGSMVQTGQDRHHGIAIAVGDHPRFGAQGKYQIL